MLSGCGSKFAIAPSSTVTKASPLTGPISFPAEKYCNV